MKKVIVVLLLIIVAIVVFYWYKTDRAEKWDAGPQQQPLVLKKHSDTFNKSVSHAINTYFVIKDALVVADTAKVKSSCRQFIELLDSIPVSELKKDTAGIFETAQQNVNDIKMNATSLLKQTDITAIRQDFKMVSEMLYPFLKIINYEGPRLYWQNCPMAFDDKEANWISNSPEIINPYLGKNHPKYKSSMLHCGEVKDSLQ